MFLWTKSDMDNRILSKFRITLTADVGLNQSCLWRSFFGLLALFFVFVDDYNNGVLSID